MNDRPAPNGFNPLFERLPVRRRTLNVDGVATAVVDGGQGPLLVLLHGGIQSGGLVWWRVLAGLLERYRVVVPDLPGLGQSDPVPQLDAGTFGDWLGRLLALVGDERPIVVAHSAPAALAARFAARHDATLGQLVLVDPAGLASFRPSPGFLIALLRANARPSPTSTERFLGRVLADLGRTRADAGEQWEAFVAAVASCSAVPAVKRSMRQLVKAGTKRLTGDELDRIRVPTALMWGRGDPLIPVGIGEAVAAERAWPLVVIEDAGHLPHVEQPDAFVSALTRLTGDRNRT